MSWRTGVCSICGKQTTIRDSLCNDCYYALPKVEQAALESSLTNATAQNRTTVKEKRFRDPNIRMQQRMRWLVAFGLIVMAFSVWFDLFVFKHVEVSESLRRYVLYLVPIGFLISFVAARTQLRYRKKEERNRTEEQWEALREKQRASKAQRAATAKYVRNYLWLWLLEVIVVMPIGFVLHDWVLVNHPRAQDAVIMIMACILFAPAIKLAFYEK